MSPNRLLLLGTGGTGDGGGPAPPAPPSADLFAHYQADSLGLADAALVDTWPDEGPNGYDLTGAGATRPTFRENQANGLPTVQFAAGNILQRAGVPNPGTVGATVWVLMRNPADGQAGVLHWNNDLQANANNILNLWLPLDGQMYFQHGDATVDAGRIFGPEPSGFRGAMYHIIEAHKPDSVGGGAVIKVDGVQRVVGTFTDELAPKAGGGILALGKNWFGDFVGYIGEVIIYSEPQSAANRAATQQYLSDKWSFGL